MLELLTLICMIICAMCGNTAGTVMCGFVYIGTIVRHPNDDSV